MDEICRQNGKGGRDCTRISRKKKIKRRVCSINWSVRSVKRCWGMETADCKITTGDGQQPRAGQMQPSPP